MCVMNKHCTFGWYKYRILNNIRMHRMDYVKKINLSWFNSIMHLVCNIQIYTIKTHFLMHNNACLLIQLHVVRETYTCLLSISVHRLVCIPSDGYMIKWNVENESADTVTYLKVCFYILCFVDRASQNMNVMKPTWCTIYLLFIQSLHLYTFWAC
jgi:hypothetical protein